MRSLLLACLELSAVALLVAAAPASAAELVTTSDTDFDPASVLIVSPEDGAVIDGSPDAVVQVTIEHEGFPKPSDITLRVDDVEVGPCPDAPPCTIEVTVAPGVHKLWAIGDDGVALRDEHEISLEVKDTGSASEGSASESDTETGSDTEPTGGAEPATDTDANETDATGDATDGSGSGDKEGCGCKAAPGLPDLLGLALLALFAPWRRRRHA
ncbi:hypothetical protein OV079_34650 [Nannocystis pusilla]|uniref:MYXO-CTERM domain-containing protein n=1 Tax=Nannocystis pusilla TaxID=889268 RepID=A0A9X3J1E6_9BACT|nr:hypothetical protein [Nannocystis pusilla]MCY1010619.1 hypothetical protein [Nannocystis pusilla]